MTSDSRRFRSYAAATAVVATAIVVGAALTNPAPPIASTALLCLLVVYCTHRSVEFADRSFVSADSMILLASVVALHPTSPLLGPALVALSRGIYLPQVRSRSWSLIALNASSGVIGVSVAVGVMSAFPSPETATGPLLLAIAVLTSIAWSVVPVLVLAPAFALRGSSARAVLSSCAPQVLSYLPFSVVGFLVGRLFIGIGAAAILMLIVPILIAREMFASYIRVKDAHEETVQMLIRALEQKDRYTAGHAERVAHYARYIGEELSFMPARLERLQFAALMHDIGKLVVPNHILNKPGRLTPEEFEKIRMHEKVGVQMLSHIDFLRPIAAATHGDNMRFDPDDLDHPIEPYIVMIADAYDAMTSTRAYRKALPQHVAFQELRDKAGIQFHPRCVEALIHAIETKGEKHGAGFEQPSEFVDAPDTGLGSAGLGDLLPSETQ